MLDWYTNSALLRYIIHQTLPVTLGYHTPLAQIKYPRIWVSILVNLMVFRRALVDK